MKNLFTYPYNLNTNYIDPDYIGDANSGMTKRINSLLSGTYLSWSGLDPIGDLGTTTPLAEQSISKFVNYFDSKTSSRQELTLEDFWRNPIVQVTKDQIAGPNAIQSADTLSPATITTAAPHDFQDGQKIKLTNFDGSWGDFYDGDVFYAKRISSTQLRCATDSGLTLLVGFTQEQTLDVFDGALDLAPGDITPGSILLDLNGTGLTPSNGSHVIFNSIEFQASNLEGITYYIGENDPSGAPGIFTIYQDALLMNPLTFNEIVPMTSEQAVTIENATNPGIIITGGNQLTADELKVYINTPKEWAGGEIPWNSDQFYYLKPTANQIRYEVYTDAAYTNAVSFDFPDLNLLPPQITTNQDFTAMGGIALAAAPSGQPAAFILASHGLSDGDAITVLPVPSSEWGNDSTGIISDNIWYIKKTNLPTRNGFDTYDLYYDQPLTNQLTVDYLTLGTDQVLITPNSTVGPTQTQFVYSTYGAVTPATHKVGWFNTRTVLNEANTDFGLYVGDELQWTAESYGARVDLPGADVDGFSIPVDITETLNSSQQPPQPTNDLDAFTTLEFWIDPASLPRWASSSPGFTTSVILTDIEKNGQQWLNYGAARLYNSGLTNSDGKILHTLQQSPDNMNTPMKYLLTSHDPINPHKLHPTPTMANPMQLVFPDWEDPEVMDLKGHYTYSTGWASGNSFNNGAIPLAPVAPQYYQYPITGYKLTPTTDPKVFDVAAADGSQFNTSGVFETTISTADVNNGDYEFWGPTSTFDEVKLRLNSGQYPSGSYIEFTFGDYVSTSPALQNRLYLEHINAAEFKLYKDEDLTIPLTSSDWNITNNQHDQILTVRWEQNGFKVYDANGDLYERDVVVKIQDTPTSVDALKHIGNIAIGDEVLVSSDGLLYEDDAKQNQVVISGGPAYIDHMTNSAKHGYFPEASSANNRLWQATTDDGNNIVLNDPTNPYYAAFTLDDYTNLDLAPGETFEVSGLGELPFELTKIIQVPNGFYDEATQVPDNGPITIQALGTGSTAYTFNGNKLYRFVDYDPILTTAGDLPVSNTQLTVDPVSAGELYGESAADNLDFYKPYMFKRNKITSNVGQSNYTSPLQEYGPTVGVKLKISNGIGETYPRWVFFRAEGWDTGISAPTGSIDYKVSLFNSTNPNLSMQQSPMEFPAVNITRTTDVTGVDLGDAFGMHNWMPYNSNFVEMNEGWGSRSVSTNINEAEMYNVDYSITARRFTVPKLEKYTLNKLTEIRPYGANMPSSLSEVEGVTCQVDDNNNNTNSYYGYFNSGDIIEDQSGAQWVLIKSNQLGSQLSIDTTAVADVVNGQPGGSLAWFPDTAWTTNGKFARSYECEEFIAYRMYPGNLPNSVDMESVLLNSKILTRYTDYTVPGYTNGIMYLQPDEDFLKAGGLHQGWTLKAGNIATVAPQADPMYDVTTPTTSFEIVANPELSVAKYYTDYTVCNVEEVLGSLTYMPFNMGDISIKRKIWAGDRMFQRPYTIGNVNDYAFYENNPLDNPDTVMSPLYTGDSNITVGEPNLVDSTTGTVNLDFASQPLPYEATSVEVIMPGNKTYSYQDTNNNTVYQAVTETDSWWNAGGVTKTDADPTETPLTVTTTVDANGKLASVTQLTNGRYQDGDQQLLEVVSPPNTYVPPVPTPAELADVWDTDDEWTTTGYDPRKEWPQHVTPMSASINLNTPSTVNNSQNGIKYTRASGFSKWTLDVEYPPMKAADFAAFHGIAQAANGQATPFLFALRNAYDQNILWAEFDKPGSTQLPQLRYNTEQGDTTMLLEGFAGNEHEAFRTGEVVGAGTNQNGSLNTVVNTVDANAFGEAKVRLAMPLTEDQPQGFNYRKNPYQAIVTLDSDDFSYNVDTAGFYHMSVSFSLDGWK